MTTRAFTTDRERWEAVLRRDQMADEVFRYAVRTTGVYCRPSCPARRPGRQHVLFFPSGPEARRAGFRPCRRCAPDGPSVRERWRAVVVAACHRIREAEEPIAPGALASAAGLSRHHFHRLFTSTVGLTPGAYIAAHRRSRVRAALAVAPTVTEAVYEAGYRSSGRFYAGAQAMLGMKPTKFRSGGRGTSIRFAIGRCDFGAILVGATTDGVCAISLGDDPDTLVRELQDRFPEAVLVGGDAGFEQWVAVIVGFVQAPGIGLDLPLDVRGTAFQQRVWQALLDVPIGTTTTYAALARRLRVPGAARAVARACGANPLAVAIPCHRVVRQDGGLAGYRWGIERKRALLAREHEEAAAQSIRSENTLGVRDEAGQARPDSGTSCGRA